jgi:hypothetical protein
MITRLNGVTPIERDKVQILEYMMEQTGAVIVLSSSWRGHDYDELTEFWDELRSVGYSKPRESLIGQTDWKGSFRGLQIQRYLDAHPEIENYIIIDDDGDMLNTQWNHFVYTDYRYGLCANEAWRGIAILKEDWVEVEENYQEMKKHSYRDRYADGPREAPGVKGIEYQEPLFLWEELSACHTRKRMT